MIIHTHTHTHTHIYINMSLKIEDLLSNKTTGNFHKSLREFYIIIFLNKLKMVENTHQKYEKNQNKTSDTHTHTHIYINMHIYQSFNWSHGQNQTAYI
jgi:hypothetical protein